MSGNLNRSRLLFTAALAASFSMSAAVANPLGFGGNKAQPAAAPAAAAPTSTPELDAAGVKCDQAHAKLEQAKKQLDAAKANLRAAEAEFRASKADKEALSLRTEARQLASAAAVDPIVSNGQPNNGLGAVSADAPTVHQLDNNGMNTTPLPGSAAAPAATLQDLVPSNVP